MRQFFVIYFFLVVLALTMFGFRGCNSTKPPIEVFPDMDRQAKFHEQGKTNFFADGRTDRQPIAGTVPFVTDKQETYSHLTPDNRFRESDYIVSGKLENNSWGNTLPIEVSDVAMAEGQKLFNIYCMICHGESGDGKGVVANERYGYNTIISLLQTRIREQPDGEIYNTITNGKGTMGAYGSKLTVEERWKVVLYLRALQRAANASIEDVPAEERGGLGI